MPRIDQIQTSRNVETRNGWSDFATHRARVTDLLLQNVTVPDARLCVLGAGNCNDLQLARLQQAFAHIELVDLDSDAVQLGIDRQGVMSDRLSVQPGFDVTGVMHLMSAWTPERPADDNSVDACLKTAVQQDSGADEARFSVVTSICLLSQLIESITQTLGADHPRFADVLTCVRREHLRRMISRTIPGGRIVLITDIVSSLTLPELATAAEADLPVLIGRAINQRNFFTGVNPFVIRQILASQAVPAGRIKDVNLSPPWLWNLGPRLYAVCALTATRCVQPPQ